MPCGNPSRRSVACRKPKIGAPAARTVSRMLAPKAALPLHQKMPLHAFLAAILHGRRLQASHVFRPQIRRMPSRSLELNPSPHPIVCRALARCPCRNHGHGVGVARQQASDVGTVYAEKACSIRCGLGAITYRPNDLLLLMRVQFTGSPKPGAAIARRILRSF